MNRKQLETLVIFFGSQNKASNTAAAASLMTYKNKKHKNIINKTYIYTFFQKLPFDSPEEVLIRFLHRSKGRGLTCFSWCHLAGEERILPGLEEWHLMHGEFGLQQCC